MGGRGVLRVSLAVVDAGEAGRHSVRVVREVGAALDSFPSGDCSGYAIATEFPSGFLSDVEFSRGYQSWLSRGRGVERRACNGSRQRSGGEMQRGSCARCDPRPLCNSRL